MSAKAWFLRWQEMIFWLPGLVIMAFVSWAALGGLSDRNDLIRWQLELPVLCAYAFAAQAFAFFVWRRARRKLSVEEKTALWNRILEGEKGAIHIFWGDIFKWTVAIVGSLVFFWPAR